MVAATADAVALTADPSGAAEVLTARAGLGADVLVVMLKHTSLVHYLEQLDALRQVVGRTFGAPVGSPA